MKFSKEMLFTTGAIVSVSVIGVVLMTVLTSKDKQLKELYDKGTEVKKEMILLRTSKETLAAKLKDADVEIKKLKRKILDEEKLIKKLKLALLQNSKKFNNAQKVIKQKNNELKKLRDVLAKKEVEVKDLKSTNSRDKQEAEVSNDQETTSGELVMNLASEINKQDIKIQLIGEKLKLSLNNKILFPSAQATLTPEGLIILKRIGKVLEKVKDKYIRVEGHTDDRAIRYSLKNKYASNWELSAVRATNVVRFLINNTNIPPKAIYAVAMSKYHPVANNSTSDGRALNRRIEILLEPKANVKDVRELQLLNDSEGAEIENANSLPEPTVDFSEIDTNKKKKVYNIRSGRPKAGVGYIWVRRELPDDEDLLKDTVSD